MRLTIIFLITVLFTVSLSTCGRRTAPVPYESAELSLPLAVVNKPVFIGSYLSISWNFEKTILDASADAFYINLFDQKATCPYCKDEPFETLIIGRRDGWKAQLQKELVSSDDIIFKTTDIDYKLYINHALLNSWRQRGLFYFTVKYKIESGLVSEQSQKTWPTWTKPISGPDVVVLEKETGEQVNQMNLVIRWKLEPEYVYRELFGSQMSDEKTKYYGLNLYSVEAGHKDIDGIRINDQPLFSGQYALIIGDTRLYASHVDRFGNESNKIQVIDNTQSQIPGVAR